MRLLIEHNRKRIEVLPDLENFDMDKLASVVVVATRINARKSEIERREAASTQSKKAGGR